MLLLPIAGVFQVFDGLQVVSIGVLRGVGDTRAPVVLNVLGFWLLGLPVSVWLGFGLAHRRDGAVVGPGRRVRRGRPVAAGARARSDAAGAGARAGGRSGPHGLKTAGRGAPASVGGAPAPIRPKLAPTYPGG